MSEYNDYFQLKNPLTRLKSKIFIRARQKMYASFMRTALPAKQSKILDILYVLIERMNGQINAAYKDNKLSIRVSFTGQAIKFEAPP